MRYQLKLVKGFHIVVIDGSNYIIDTGSPSCFGKGRSLEFCGKPYVTNRFTDNEIVRKIEEELAIEVEGFLGLKALEGRVVTLNYNDRLLEVDEPTPAYVNCVLMKRAGKRLAISATIQGIEVDAVLDTGARIAYIDPKLLLGLRQVGQHQDYTPSIGDFESKEYVAEIRIGSLVTQIPCSPAEGRLMQLLENDGLRNLLGVGTFKDKASISMDFIGMKLSF